jgi:hypothetical protein
MKKLRKAPIEIYLPIILSIILVTTFIIKTNGKHHVTQPKLKLTPKNTIVVDTPSIDNPINVSTKKALFIGDSHTAYANGWQSQLCKKTKMICINTAVGGKRTDWMLNVFNKNINSTYEYCFIWGGANDAASHYYPIEKTISNIQKMVDSCNKLGVKPIVLTGFNPELCIDISKQDNRLWGPYIPKYNRLQSEMLLKLKNCIVIKNHFITREDGDCSDFICHMSASGHKKMAIKIIEYLKFENF